jgi:hypothetical protein
MILKEKLLKIIIILWYFKRIHIYLYTTIKIKAMTNKKDMTLTSVKVQSELFEDFKIACVKYKFSLQKLADRTIHLYLTDDDFRKKVHSHNNLEIKN